MSKLTATRNELLAEMPSASFATEDLFDMLTRDNEEENAARVFAAAKTQTAERVLARIQGAHNADFGAVLDRNDDICLYYRDEAIEEVLNDSIINLSLEEQVDALRLIEDDYAGEHISGLVFPRLEVAVETEGVRVYTDPVDEFVLRAIAGDLANTLAVELVAELAA
ncbi:hypothetical protein FQ330_03280 [Agrococcus sediminis]|uniref:Uncharacterized protein n=1 Tax=Agrococcus sediminis TaxID=2599924 RepID=A0A5M8QN44_9MICO|nr:hypothetical protein [Agrococcus sediminis]KAA6436440.1 hypothetical protein FQ330_03280 [Agrococcus sediminis]